MVTPAVSVSFFRSEFDAFLYAPMGAERNEDPWKEAAELSELPKDTATQRLAALIARLPGERWAPADPGAIASRLIELLPRHGFSNMPLASKGHGFRGITGGAVTKMLICAALAGC